MNKTKNEDNWKAFGPWWFEKHQSKILWCLNAPVVGMLARWILRIHRDCPKAEIIDIKPNCYTIRGKKEEEYVTDFRTHWKFAKRVYFAFKPVWWIMHAWDEIFADKFIPQMSFGFDTLTSYPDAGSGVTTCDGYTLHGDGFTNYTFANLIAGAGEASSVDGTAIYLARLRNTTGTPTNRFRYLYRGLLTFDTSSLTSGAEVSAVTLTLEGVIKNNGLGESSLEIVSSAPASNNNIVNGDHDSLGSTSFSSKAYGDYSAGGYPPGGGSDNDFTFNASGIAHVSKTGITCLGTRIGWDLNGSFTGSWSATGDTYYTCVSADYTGTSYDPKLVVTYTAGEPPAGGGLQQVIII